MRHLIKKATGVPGFSNHPTAKGWMVANGASARAAIREELQGLKDSHAALLARMEAVESAAHPKPQKKKDA